MSYSDSFFSVSYSDAYGLPVTPLNYCWQQDQLWTCPYLDGGICLIILVKACSKMIYLRTLLKSDS